MIGKHDDIDITCADGYHIIGRSFRPDPVRDCARTAIITAATGAKASYYWRYAEFLAAQGFHAVVADYRGIGRSVPPKGVRELATRWHEWGTLDVEALIRWVQENEPERTIVAVGHSFGGLAVCLAPSAHEVSRLLMVGAQQAHWPDYAPWARAQMVWRWHVAMPALTMVAGYFPGRRLGWTEDLPRGVALDWARGRRDFAATIGPEGDVIMSRMAGLGFDVLATSATDDPFATDVATERLLAYLPRARVERCRIDPPAVGVSEIGHLGLFHARFRDVLWPRSATWLRSAG